MKDRVWLVLIGVLYAGLGWAIWHFFGAEAPWVISTLVLVAVIVDNARLRCRLRNKSQDNV